MSGPGQNSAVLRFSGQVSWVEPEPGRPVGPMILFPLLAQGDVLEPEIEQH